MHEDVGTDVRADAGSAVTTGFMSKVSIAVALTIVLLVAGECAAYFLLRQRVGFYDYEYRSYVIWRVTPSLGGSINIDNGLRRTLHSRCAAGAYSIWMFGGSGLWGNFNRDGETIASHLAKRYEDLGRQVCILNYGQRGWSNTQEVIQLMLDLKRAARRPDLVLFYDGTVDAALPAEGDDVDVHQGFRRFKQKFEGWNPGREAGFSYLLNTNTYLALQWLAERLQRGQGPPPRRYSDDEISQMVDRTLANYSNNRDVVKALSQAYGFQYLFLVEPFLPTAEKPLTPAEARLVDEARVDAGSTQIMAAVYRALQALKRDDVVYLGDAFKDRAEKLFIDPTHFNAAGSHLMAERIAEILRARGFEPIAAN